MTAAHDIRLLLSDVDGTLVTKDKLLTDAARAAVRALRDAGVGFAITSARPPRGVRMLIEPLDLKLPLAGFNGGIVAYPDLSVIESHPVDPRAARKIVDLLERRGIEVWVYTETDWCVRDPNGPHVAREAWILKFDATVVDVFTDAQLARAFKIVGVSDDSTLLDTVHGQIQAEVGDAVGATRSEAHFLDVTDPKANKGHVVDTLARRLGLSAHQIATIGDMPNDVLMFQRSGFSIAMGNASDAVKAKASVATDTNEADGFAKAVQKFLLGAAAA